MISETGHMYILECSNGSLNVGSTIDLERRLVQHQIGEGANYTKLRRPVILLHLEEYSRADEAFEREKQVQNWSRAKRLALIGGRTEELREASRKRDASGHMISEQGLAREAVRKD